MVWRREVRVVRVGSVRRTALDLLRLKRHLRHGYVERTVVGQPSEDAAAVDYDQGGEELVAVEHDLPLFGKEGCRGLQQRGHGGPGLGEGLA